MEGKEKCKMLRELRKKIAQENNIPFSSEECNYKGECKGTCPKCDAELAYLEAEVQRRNGLGKIVALSAGMALALSACNSEAGDMAREPADSANHADQKTENREEAPTVSSEYATPRPESDVVLEGDFPYIPNPTKEMVADYLVNTVVYPAEMVMQRKECSIIVNFKYSHEGEISDLKIENSTDPQFNKAIETALSKMSETLDGADLEDGQEYSIPLDFKFSK